MISKEQVLKIAESRGMKSFIVRNPQGDLVHASDNPASVNSKMEELREFLNSSSGIYKIELRNTAGKGVYLTGVKMRNAIRIGDYDVNLSAPAQSPKGILGLGMDPGGMGNFQMIREYEKEIRELERKNTQLENKIAILEMQIAGKDTEHKRALEEATSSDRRIMGFLDRFGDIVTPQTTKKVMQGIAGLGSEDQAQNPNSSNNTENSNNMDPKERVAASIRRLAAVDPELVDHLEKLADLAENDPDKFKMAISFL